MTLTRRILHHGPHPDGTPVVLDDRAIRGCWFELHRQGGCGTGEIRLLDQFPLRRDIEPGDWISIEGAPDDRWYLGRVETCRSESPAGMTLQLEGMAIQLNEVFPGGFGSQADGVAPHRYAATELFSNDPDFSHETADFVESVDDVIHLLLQQYVTPATHIHYDPAFIESPLHAAEVTSLKFRGEETVRTVIKDLAMRAQGASWGVNAAGEFYFLRPRDVVLRTFQESIDLVSLTETRDREYLYNRLLLTGDYVYDRRELAGDIARRAFRWRGNFLQPESRARHGERRLRLWLPWIRTQADSRAFAREFFRTYANPTPRFLVETLPQTALFRPWEGRIALHDKGGHSIATARVETVRVLFDQAPSFRLELGPENPRDLWPEPPQDERWETPEQINSIGGPVSSLDVYRNSEADPPGPASSATSSLSIDHSSNHSLNHSSDVSSDHSSDHSSHDSSQWSTTASSHWTSTSWTPLDSTWETLGTGTGTGTGTGIDSTGDSLDTSMLSSSSSQISDFSESWQTHAGSTNAHSSGYSSDPSSTHSALSSSVSGPTDLSASVSESSIMSGPDPTESSSTNGWPVSGNSSSTNDWSIPGDSSSTNDWSIPGDSSSTSDWSIPGDSSSTSDWSISGDSSSANDWSSP